MKDVRILLVGDPQVGKTSLVLSLVGEEFPEEVPARTEEITIPADITPEKVPTHIVDYSAQEQTEDILGEEIIKANVVCIVYDVTDEGSIERITSFWLPLLRQVAVDQDEELRPVIIVGNKSDLLEGSTMDTILPVMNEYAEVETCVECSAKNLKNISEMFYYSQKAVLHPSAPLYNPEEKQLKPLCANALKRIFKICDVDNDGLLSDKELNDFQHRCFNAPLQGQGLQEVKNVVRKNTTDGLQDGAVTLKGFLFLHTLFIQRGRHETVWTVLRKFGYGDELKLRTDYLCPALDVGAENTVELSDAGFEFLIDLFNRHDKDEAGALSPMELQELFSTCPSMPWSEEVLTSVQTNEFGWITLQGFLAQWVLSTFLDYTRTLSYLATFGYTHQENETLLSSAVTVTRSRTVDLQKKQTTRSVFQCHVFGPPGVGKTSFLQAFLGKNLEPADMDKVLSQYVVNLVDVHRQEKYLVLREIEWEGSGFLLYDRRCDVACFLYDVTDPSSFAQVVELREKLPKTVPCLFVASKSNGSSARQEYDIQPAMYCNLNKLPPPLPFAPLPDPEVYKDMYSRIARVAVYPTWLPTWKSPSVFYFRKRRCWVLKFGEIKANSITREYSPMWAQCREHDVLLAGGRTGRHYLCSVGFCDDSISAKRRHRHVTQECWCRPRLLKKT